MPIDRDAALRTAEKLLRQGKLDAAIDQYVRLIAEQPEDWNAINTLGDLYARAGSRERAVAQYSRVADHFFSEGFLPKAAAVYKKTLKVRPEDEHTVLRLADIAIQQGLVADGKQYLRQLAQQRQDGGDTRGAAECLLRLGAVDDSDAEAKVSAARAALTLGLTGQAVTLFQEAAAVYDKAGRAAEALDALVGAAEVDRDNAELTTRVARALIAAGQPDRAQPFLTIETAGDDADLLIAVGRGNLLSGHSADGYATLMRAVAIAPDRAASLASLADELLASGRSGDAYACVEIVVDAALFQAEFERAAAVLEDFLARERVVPGLLKLVDVCVDAGFDDRVAGVQGRLADAYLDAGQAQEARAIAEDLFIREAGAEAHVDRLRRALEALAIADPDAEIARLREAASIFAAPLDPIAPAETPARTPAAGNRTAPAATAAGSEPRALPEMFEIDLSDTIAQLELPVTATAAPGSGPSRDRDEDDPAAGLALFDRAQEHLRLGMTAEAAGELQAAARLPQLRFKAAAQLGRLSVSRGDLRGGVEWLERAAEALSPSENETFALLYDLADALALGGEPARALAVFIELEAGAGDYLDVRERIDRLTSAAATQAANGERK